MITLRHRRIRPCRTTIAALGRFAFSLLCGDAMPLFVSTGGDGDFNNYRFFGVANPGGISSIFIANDGGGIEVDRLQFGFGPSRALPELSTWAMMIVGFGLTAWRLHSRNRARYTTA